MTGGRKQVELLRELHQDTSLADRIRQCLDGACQHDDQARALRCEAGRHLAALRDSEPQRWRQLAGMDHRLADLLLSMASGRP